jgi:glyoxylase-like metal-dependent hydrolase (beta-lactamase superfamily II)
MDQITKHVFKLESIPICNVYLLDIEDGYYLVDSGLFGYAEAIRDELEREGYPLSNLKGILHTHGHGDHIGNSPALAERCDAPVMGHEADLPFFQKSPDLPAKSPFQRTLLRLADRFLFQQPPLIVDVFLEEGQKIPSSSGWEVLYTPGHTPGSISFYQPEQGILLCGDALFNQHPATRIRGLRLPLPLISVDSQTARASVQKLAHLDLKIICPGHGFPLTNNLSKKLEQLLESKTRSKEI